MKLHVHKNPSARVRADVREVADDAADPQAPWEVMTVEDYKAWLVAQPPLSPAPAPVPESVSRRQLKEWLIRNGLIDTVEAILDGIPDATEKRIARNWWTESIEFRRDHPLVGSIAAVLNKTSDEVDQIWRDAAEL